MKEYLNKLKRQGKIDFIEVDLDWGRTNKEFILYSFETKKFSRIFYDNKYREDYLKTNELILYIKDNLKKYESGLDDRGIHNTRYEYNKIKTQLDFVKKYENRTD